MDVVRDPAILRRKRLRQVAYIVAALIAVVLVSVALARMEPAAPAVDRATLLVDTVKRGPFVRQVRGLGTLVPEDTRWLPATTDGRVERILLRPGAVVEADSVILELSNPQVEQEALNARLALRSAEAALENLRVQLQNDLLTQQAQVASIEAEFKQAEMDAAANDALAKQQLVSTLIQRQSQLRADTLKTRVEIEQKRYAMASGSIEARTRVQQAAVDQARAVADLQQSRLADLQVRPGFAGVLQQVPVEVGRPAFGQEQSTIALFKVLDAAGHAARVQVRVGRSSVNTIEVLSGLNEGDQVVLSDMSAWDGSDRVRLR